MSNRNFTCFSEAQKSKVYNYLDQFLDKNSPYFYRLISRYKIYRFNSFLENNINYNLYDTIMEDFNKCQLNESTRQQLLSMATLANLGNFEVEKLLINDINKVFSTLSINDKKRKEENVQFSGCTGSINVFFSSLIPNIFSVLNTKYSIINTMYLLDVEDGENIDDVAIVYGGTYYAQMVLMSKLKYNTLSNLIENNFRENIEKLKEIIRNDDSIWLDDIKK